MGAVRGAKSKRLPRAVREQQMLDAAVRTFGRRGYRAASMDEIAELAGVSKPLVYLYLNSKEELFTACIRREAAALLAAVRDAAEPDPPAEPDLSARDERGLSAPDESGLSARDEPGRCAPDESHVSESHMSRSDEPGLSPERQLWAGLMAFFTHTAENPDGWSVLHRQARTHGEPFAREVGAMRNEIVDHVATLIAAAAAQEAGARRREPEPGARDVTALAQALVGAAESLAGWMNDTGAVSAREAATTLMNLAWVGLGDLLTGARWSSR
ncbi:helix-turn-helix domain-containing protein [Streptomyces sp. NPDC051018]|uniref:helix-turn-helix domain-containing protein n=1 Tax=Streptomyces sp. NPDC051018 TaxID=3365639 RepID=UPI003796182B